MRNVTFPCIAVVLAMALVFLASTPQMAVGHPAVSLLTGAVSMIKPFLVTYLMGLRGNKKTGGVEIKLWTQTDKPKMNGCGFFFEVTTATGRKKSKYFPSVSRHTCPGMDDYKLRLTSAGSMYSKTIHMGNDQVKSVEVHADGWHDTLFKMMCVGLSAESIVGGPRAICITNEFLKSCQSLTNKWSGIDLTSKDIMMTRSLRGIHKIVFRDVEQFIEGYEALESDSDNENAARKTCNQVDLVMGSCGEGNWRCSGLVLQPVILEYGWVTYSEGEAQVNPTLCIDAEKPVKK